MVIDTTARRYRCLIIVAVFGAAVLCCDKPVSAASLRAGAAKRSIVPPFPTHMGGFHDRVADFEGVHDDLFVRALVLDNEQTQVVIIGSDLMAIDGDMVRLVREQIERETSIPAGNILVSCAHNHSAPSYYQLELKGEKDPPLKKFLVDRFVEAAVDAFQNRVPAAAGFRAGELRGASTNRQQGNDDVIDPQVGVFRVVGLKDRQPIAVLFNFTAHPVILGSKNLLLSGEYPGAAARAVEDLMGGVAIFTQGACGDVTVHRNGDPYEEIERVGRTLAGEVIKTAGFIRGSETLALSAASRSLSLEPRTVPKLEDARAELQRVQASLERAKQNGANPQILRDLNQKLRLLHANVRIAEQAPSDTGRLADAANAEVQVLRFGECVLVAVPGEIFVEFALELRQRIQQSVNFSTVLVGYANGYVGYIVTPRAVVTGGYEASVRRVHVNSGRRMIEAAIELTGEIVQSE